MAWTHIWKRLFANEEATGAAAAAASAAQTTADAAQNSADAAKAAADAVADDLAASQQMLHVRDEKPSGTAGGAATAGAWRTRDLNTVVTNTIPGASLAGNQITLPPGKYLVHATAPAYGVNGVIARISDVSGSNQEILGTPGYAVSSTYGAWQSRSEVNGIFIITESITFELQQKVGITRGTNGLGASLGIPDVNEIYSEVIIRRIA